MPAILTNITFQTADNKKPSPLTGTRARLRSRGTTLVDDSAPLLDTAGIRPPQLQLTAECPAPSTWLQPFEAQLPGPFRDYLCAGLAPRAGSLITVRSRTRPDHRHQTIHLPRIVTTSGVFCQRVQRARVLLFLVEPLFPKVIDFRAGWFYDVLRAWTGTSALREEQVTGMSDIVNGNGGTTMSANIAIVRLRAPFSARTGAPLGAIPCHGLPSGRFWGH